MHIYYFVHSMCSFYQFLSFFRENASDGSTTFKCIYKWLLESKKRRRTNPHKTRKRMLHRSRACGLPSHVCIVRARRNEWYIFTLQYKNSTHRGVLSSSVASFVFVFILLLSILCAGLWCEGPCKTCTFWVFVFCLNWMEIRRHIDRRNGREK